MIYSESKKSNFMSKITSEEIEKLAKLARVGLTEEEKGALATDMTAILEYVKELDSVDVTNVEPTSQVTGLTNVSRTDAIIDCDLDTGELLSNAPDTEEGFIKVKSVL